MVLVDFCGGDPRRAAVLYQAYIDAGGPARISEYGCFTMVIVQSVISGSARSRSSHRRTSPRKARRTASIG